MKRLYLTLLLFLILAACAPDTLPVDDPTSESSPAAPKTFVAEVEPKATATAEPEAATVLPVTDQPELRPTQPSTPASEATKETVLFASLEPTLPPPTAVPSPVPLPLIEGDPDITVYALLGNDMVSSEDGRTDSIILAAVNPGAKRVTLLSLPRDLYLDIPGWGMGRINTAFVHGGAEMFKETVAYNLDLPVDHIIRVGFDGFKDIIDALGGVDVVVNCPVDDYRLKSPELNPQLRSSWEPFELGYGVQSMDGDLALWYARSRHGSNDFDRGRRQQKILRALWQKTRLSPETLTRLPALVQTVWTAVETDLSLSDALILASQAAGWHDYSVEHLLLPQESLRPWRVPGSGAQVVLLDRDKAEATLQTFLADPALNSAKSAPIRVVVQSEDYVLYHQAAENLAWYGFQPIYGVSSGESATGTTITYYSPSLKGAYPDRLSWIFDQETADIQLQSIAADPPHYYVHLAPDYDPCLDYLKGPGQ